MSRPSAPAPPDLRDAREADVEDDARATPAPTTWPTVNPAEQLFEEYERARRQTPRDPSLHLKFGMAALEQGRGLETKAVEALTRYVKLKPDDPEGHYHLGLAHAAKGSYEEAARSYLAALELDENDPDILLALHFAYFARLRFAEARNCIERAEKIKNIARELATDPRMFSCWKGVDLLLSGDDCAAEPHLREAAESEGFIGDAGHYALALLAVGRGDRPAVELHREELESRQSSLLPSLDAAISRGTVEPREAVLALTGRPQPP